MRTKKRLLTAGLPEPSYSGGATIVAEVIMFSCLLRLIAPRWRPFERLLDGVLFTNNILYLYLL